MSKAAGWGSAFTKANQLQNDIYRSMVETGRQTVIVADARDEIVRCDADQMLAIFGYSAAEVAGANMRLLLPIMSGNDHKAYIERYGVSIEEVSSDLGHTVSGAGKDGTAIPLDLNIVEDRGEDGVLHFSWILRDVGERLRLNAELREIIRQASAAVEVEHELLNQVRASNLELKVTNENLQKITSIVAHDLRAPLRRIEAFIEVLRTDFSESLNEEGLDILGRIGNGASRMKQMLDSLQQYARLNGMALEGKTAMMAEVASEALSAFDAEALGVEVRVSVDACAEARGDPVLLSHVLQNLVGNALKFRAADAPVIHVDCAEVDGQIEVSVADNGIGIEPRFANKIFEMFYRLHDEEAFEGTGVGLTVCRKIITDHGGRIWLDTSAPGLTRFVFTVPQATEEDRLRPIPPRRPRFAAAPVPAEQS